jgi:hypothetical protein
MGGSEDESRVSAVGSDASSMLSPESAKRSSRKKSNCKSIRMDRIRTGKDSSIRTRRTSEIQIEHQTKLSQDETDLAREGLLRKCVRNSMRLHVALQKSTPSNARRRRRAFGNQKPLPKIASSDIYGLRPGRFAVS